MARLYVLSGDLIGRTFDVEGEAVIGRADEAEVAIRAASVSRRHARLEPLGKGRWRVRDLESSNGTFVEGARVDDAVLGDGDEFRVGDVELRLRDAHAAAGEGGGIAGGAVGESPPEPEPEPEPEAELELEFEDDLDAALGGSAAAGATPAKPGDPGARSGARPARRGAPGGTPGGASQGASPRTGTDPRPGAAASRERATRRAAALGAAPRGPAVQDGGRPILQYAETRSGGTDVSQIGGVGRLLLVVLAIALVAGVAYGAFWLAQGL